MCLGIPGRIVEVPDAQLPVGIVEIGGVRRSINIAFIADETHTPAQCVGDWVLVHVGFAMSRIDEQEAARTLALLTELDEAQGELQLMRESGARSYGGADVPG